MRLTREAGLVAYRAFSDVAGKGAFFLITVFAARRLTQYEFGVFSLGATFGWMAAVATDFGIQLHLARAVARNPDQAYSLLRAWLRVRLSTSAVAMLVIVAGLALSRIAADQAFAIFLLVLVYIVSGLIEFIHYFYRAVSRSDIESTLTLWQRFLTLATAMIVLILNPAVGLLAVAMLLPALATLTYSVRRATILAADRSAAAPDISSPVTVEAAIHDILPIGLGIVLSALYFRIDVFLIDIWNGTSAVALYNAVFRLVEALRLFPAAVLAVAMPALFRATSARPLLGVSAVLIGFSSSVAIVLSATGDWLVPLLYGEGYADAVPAFRILLASLPLMSLNYALTHQLIGWNGHRAYAAICAAALVFNLVLNARLIPLLSISGAAWSTLATEGLLTVGCAIALWIRTARPTGAHTAMALQ